MLVCGLYLAIAITFEIAGTICMKLSNGFSNFIPSVLIFVFYGPSFIFLTFALKKIDVSIVYAIWSGVGTGIITMIGIAYFREPATIIKLTSIGLIIIGVVGLNFSGVKH